jgi:hypothetical protein
MTYDEAVSISNDLRTRFDAPFSNIDKQAIAELYGEVMGKAFQRTNCQQCYHDALIEIVLYLKREKRMAEKCNYRLRAGYILNSPNFRGGKIFTNDNLTDEVAAEYLTMFPANATMFQTLPAKGENKPAQAKKASSSTTIKARTRKAVKTQKRKK